MVLVRKLGGLSKDSCKTALRNWMCWEFFKRCNTAGDRFYKVCKSSCDNAKSACGAGWIDCNEEVQEYMRTAPEW